MDTNFANNQVTLTTRDGTFTVGFVERAIRFALSNGFADDGEKKAKEFTLAVHTPAGPITARPSVDADNYLGIWLDRLVGDRYIALSTSEYQVAEDVFETHTYLDFSLDEVTKSYKHFFSNEEDADEDRKMRLLRAAG